MRPSLQRVYVEVAIVGVFKAPVADGLKKMSPNGRYLNQGAYAVHMYPQIEWLNEHRGPLGGRRCARYPIIQGERGSVCRRCFVHVDDWGRGTETRLLAKTW